MEPGTARMHAEYLQRELKSFIGNQPEEREENLGKLINNVRRWSSTEVMAHLTSGHDYNSRLAWAARAATQTEYYNEVTGTLVTPWNGGYTLVAITPSADIVAAVSNPVGEVYKHYQDLFPYAMSKAVLAWYLSLMGEDPSIDNEVNWEHMKPKLAKANLGLFQGDYVTQPIETPFGVSPLIIGASGCELTEEYLEPMLPMSLYDLPQRLRVNNTAGEGDTQFATLVGHRLENPQADESIVKEPEVFRKNRRIH